MAWWQIALIIVGAIVIGLAGGYLLNNVIVRASAAMKKREKAPVIEPAPQMAQEPPVTVEPSVPDLYAEIEYNRRIASSDWSGEPQPFVTRAWDNRGEEVHALPVDLRNELTEAYSDMALANSITWLSTEMGRRSQSLDESYLKLRSSVAERLNRVKLRLSHPGQPEKITSLS